MSKKLHIASPLGFCAGVRRAVNTVEAMLNSSCGQTLYVYNEIVHNTTVVESFRQRKVVFVKSVSEVPEGETLIFSAHGVSKEVEQAALKRNLSLIDATCPLVTSLHMQARHLAEAGDYVVLIGHPNHPEVIGTLGQLPEDYPKLVIESAEEVSTLPTPQVGQQVKVLVQTTLNSEAINPVLASLKTRFDYVELCGSHCYATENRQNAVRVLAEHSEYILIIGSPHSSNSKQLCQVAKQSGCRATLIDNPSEIDLASLANISNLGISAGASAPPELLEQTIAILQANGFTKLEELHTVTERTDFPLPNGLKNITL